LLHLIGDLFELYDDARTCKLQKGNKHSDAKNFILPFTYVRHVCNRWQTSDLHVVINDIQAFVP